MKHQRSPLYIQRGGAYRGCIQYHRNPAYTQRGNGLGSIFRNLWRFSIPLVKRAAASGMQLAKENSGTIGTLIKDQALETGMKIAANALKKSQAKAERQSGTGIRIASASLRHKNQGNDVGITTNAALPVKKRKVKHNDIFS